MKFPWNNQANEQGLDLSATHISRRSTVASASRVASFDCHKKTSPWQKTAIHNRSLTVD